MITTSFRRCAACAVLLLLLGLLTLPSNASDADSAVQGGKTLAQWRQDLKSPDPSLRWQAVEALGQLGQRHPRAAVWALERALHDDDLDVRLQAVAALTVLRQQAEPAVPALGEALLDKDSDLRRQAALALASIGPLAEQTAPQLARALQDPNANVRLAAIAALQAMGADAAPATDSLLGSLQDKVPSVRRASATALAVLVPQVEPPRSARAVPALARALNDADPEVRRRAVAALGAIGPRAEAATAALGTLARTPGAPASREAALALGRIGGTGLAELTRALEHANVNVRLAAAQGLQLLGAKARPAFGPLARALTDSDPSVRQSAAAALQASDPEPNDVLPLLKRSLADKDDSTLRWWAVAYVGNLGAAGVDKPQTQAAVTLLAGALADDSAAVRAQAALALGTIGPDARAALPALRESIRDTQPSVRQNAALALGRIDPQAAREAIPILLQALIIRVNRYSAEPFNKDVAVALANIGAVEPLVEALENSKEEGIRAGVTFALVQMGPRARGAFKYLQKGLQNPEASARQRSADAMQAILPDPREAVPVLILALRHDDDSIRCWAAAFLAQLARSDAGPEVGDALPALLDMLKSEAASDARVQAVEAVSAILAHGKEAPPPLLEQQAIQALVARLQDANHTVRQTATAALGHVGAARKGQGPIAQAIPALLEELTHGRPYQAEAANALGQIGLVAPLLEALKHSPSEKIRAGAAHALQRIGPALRDQVPALVTALADKDCHVRHQVALALAGAGRFGGAAVPALTAALEDVDPVVPPGAAFALTRLGPEADSAADALGKALSSPSAELRGQAQAALVAIGPAALPALRTGLASRDVTTVILAAQAVQQIGRKARPAIPDLLKASGQADPGVKAATATALVVLQARTPEAIPALTLVVSDPDVDLASAAVTLLHELKANTPAVVTALAARLEANPSAYPTKGAKQRFAGVELHKLLIRSLGGVGANARPAVPELTAALENPDLREDAAQALLAILAHGVRRSEVVKVLKEQDLLTERELALVLGSADGEVVTALIAYLGSPNARVRSAAALSLGRLGSVASSARPALIKTLTDGNTSVRLEALHALAQQALDPREQGKRHPEVLAALTAALAHWDSATREEAALWLAHVAVKEPLPTPEGLKTALPAAVLIAALQNEANPQRQHELIDALKELAAIRTDLHLARAMAEGDLPSRERLTLALGAVTAAQDHTAAVGSLVEALNDRHLTLRRQAARALGQLAQAEGLDLKPATRKAVADALETALGQRDPVVRLDAALALWRFTHQTDQALPVLLEALESLAYTDPELIAKLRDGKNINPTLLALVGMAEQDEKVRQALVTALKQDKEPLRSGAIVVVGSMKKPTADLFAQPLVAALADRSATVRLQAAVALRHLELNAGQQEQVLPRLESALTDANSEVKLQAVTTLSVLAPRSPKLKLEPLQVALDDSDARVRTRAALTLGRTGPRGARAVPGLRLALKDQDMAVRHQAATSLAEVGAAGLPGLQEALRDKDYDMRKEAAMALGGMGPAAREALPALRMATKDKDEEVAAAAVAAVKKVEAGEGR